MTASDATNSSLAPPPASSSGARSHTNSPSLLTRPLHLTPASSARALTALGNALPPHHPAKALHPPPISRTSSRSASFSGLLGSLTSRDFGLIIIGLVLLGLLLHFGLLFYLVVRLKGGDSAPSSSSPSVNTIALELHAENGFTLTQAASSAGTVGGDRSELASTLTGVASEAHAEAVGIATLATIVATPTAPPSAVELAPAAAPVTVVPVSVLAPTPTPIRTPIGILKRIIQVTDAPHTRTRRDSSEDAISPADLSVDSVSEVATYSSWISEGGAPVLTGAPREPLSIVYSWCNGTDPRFVDVRSTYAALKPARPSAANAARQANQAASARVNSVLPVGTIRRANFDPDVNRFRQFDELRFSIRSVYKHAHSKNIHIKNVFLLVHDCLEPTSADGVVSQACMPKQMNANGVLPETFAAHRTNPEDATQGSMQIPQWLDVQSPALGLEPENSQAESLVATVAAPIATKPTSSEGIRFGIVPHSQVFSHEDPTKTASTLAARLPTFNSFSIESRLVQLRTQLPSLTRRFVYLNDDMMFGSDLHEAHFYSPQYGLVIYAEDLLVGYNLQLDHDDSDTMAAPSLDKGKGEWAALDFTNVILSRRFGRRSRAYISHYAHVMDKDLLHEMSMDPILRLELDRSAGHRFRGDAWEVHLPFLFAHYVMERSRETMLRAYIQGRLDANHDGFIDDEERTDLTQTLAEYEAYLTQCTPNMRSLASQSAACSQRNTLVHDKIENHPGSKYLFSSLDGFGYSRKEYVAPIARPLYPGQRAMSPSPHGADSQLFTPMTSAADRRCSFVPATCFGALWNEKMLRADEALHALAHNNLQCGDCLLTILAQQSGAAGLSALLPKEKTAQVNACHADSEASSTAHPKIEYDTVADPFFSGLRPSGVSTDASSRSHATVSDHPVCPASSTYDWRMGSIRAIKRYQHVLASAVGMFIQMGSLISPFEVTKVTAKMERERPTFLCVNDDGINSANDAQRAQTNFKTIMQARYGVPSPIEQQ